MSSRESRVTGQLTDGSRGSRVKNVTHCHLCVRASACFCAKTTEPVEMAFGMWTRLGPRRGVEWIRGVPDTPDEGANFGGISRPVVKCECDPLSSVGRVGGVLREIRAYGRHLRDSSTVDESEVYEQQKHIAVTLVLVVVMFIVCWTPLVVYAIYSTLVRDEDRIHHLANPVVSIKTVKLRSGGTPPSSLFHFPFPLFPPFPVPFYRLHCSSLFPIPGPFIPLQT